VTARAAVKFRLSAPVVSRHPENAAARVSRLVRAAAVALTVLLLLLAAPSLASAAAPDPFVMTATSYSSGYSPAYVGNGYVGTRIPAQGMGYVAGATVPTSTIVTGVWQQTPSQDVVSAAPLPGWDELRFTDSGTDYSLSAGRVSHWRQSVDMHTGVISTSLDWTSPAGHTTHLAYDVFADLARQHVAAVRLRVTPTWSGSARVTDALGGGASSDLVPVSSGSVPGRRLVTLAVRTQGTNVTVAYASRLHFTVDPLKLTADKGPRQASLGVDFSVQRGKTYEFTKAVGIATSQDSGDPRSTADSESAAAGSAGFDALLSEDTSAWADRWRTDIVLPDDPAMQRRIRAAQFYLQESIRPGTNWSISPVGLSSGGYNAHIFWDAETWMYPSLLLLHPDVASSVVNYRSRTIAGARINAQQTGYQGARYAWESANDGTEQTPTWAETRTYEQHITADVALAQWQYYLATGDRGWLANQAWPVLQGAADFWASRAEPTGNGGYAINHVEGPDEHHFDVNNEVYTNVGAITTLRIATQVANLLGETADPAWTAVANGLPVLLDPATQVRPEFEGYAGDQVKQADVVMLTYPWEWPESTTIGRNDLDYYAARTDPDGPAMTDSIHAIDSLALGVPGCPAYHYTLQSVLPFVQPPYDQFTEVRNGQGTFTFLTGEGGFLQTFLYGWSGFRWRGDRIHLDPALPSQWAAHGLTLRRLSYQGRQFTVAIGATTTIVTLDSGSAVTVEGPGTTATLTPGGSVTMPTRRLQTTGCN
jgi:trehalose/maltose hydrolase-like predicted phosphorylase